MLIHELATVTGLPAHSIRFYEKMGLLGAEHSYRAENNYRHYTDKAADRLVLIKRGQAAGFTLNEMRELVRAWESGLLSIEEQAAIVAQKIQEVDTKIAELQLMRVYLVAKQRLLEDSMPLEQICEISLETLAASAS